MLEIIKPERQRGQTIVLIAIVLPVLLGMGALAVDVAHLFVEKRHTQNAVDAAALAAASQLTPGVACAGTWNAAGTCQYNVSQTVQQYSDYNGGPNQPFPSCNGSSDTNCYVTPYVTSSDPSGMSHVQVRIREATPTWFIGALGIGGPVNVSSSAAAAATPLTTTNTNTTTLYSTSTSTSVSTGTSTDVNGTSNIALFAMSTTCGTNNNNGISINNTGNNDQILGYAVSNGSVNIFGNGGSGGTFIQNVSYGGPNGCLLNDPSKTGTATTHSDTKPWPVTFTRSTICTGHDSNVPVTVTTDGIYCSAVSINVPKTVVTLNATLVAPLITVDKNGNQMLLGPATGQTLTIWQTGSNPFDFSPNKSCLSGVVWIENGDMTYTGNSACVGFYEAQNIFVTGNSVKLTGGGPPTCCITTTTVTTSTSTSTTVIPTSTITNTSTLTTGTSQGLDQ